MEAEERMSRPTPSPLALLFVAYGVIASVATTCGPPPPDTGPVFVYDTGTYTTTTEPDAPEGITMAWDGIFALGHEGDTQTFTVRATLPESCLTESADYAWGYPTGYVVFSYNLRPGAPDSGGTETGGAETGTAETGTTDTSADTGAPPPGPEPDTGAVDTAADTGVGLDTSSDTSIDTSSDTSADTSGDTSTDTSADTSADTSGDTSGDTSTDTADSSSDTATTSAGVSVYILRGDGTVTVDGTIPLTGGSASGLVEDEAPFRTCAEGAACEVTWTVTMGLLEPTPVDGTLHVRARLRMCSGAPGEEGDLALTVE